MITLRNSPQTVNPHKIVFLTQEELFQKVELSDFCGIGPRILRRLNALGIYTPSELTAYSCQLLIAEFGSHWGMQLSEMGQGIDHSPIVTQGELPPEKSFGHSYTLPKWASDRASAWTVLSRLSDQVARRMRKAGFLGRTLSAHLGFEESGWLGARETYQAPINDGREIYARAQSLLEHELSIVNCKLLTVPKVRHVGVAMTNLVPAPWNLAIFPDDQKRQRLLPTIDRLWDRYGPWSVVRADQLTAARILEPIPDGRSKRPTVR